MFPYRKKKSPPYSCNFLERERGKEAPAVLSSEITYLTWPGGISLISWGVAEGSSVKAIGLHFDSSIISFFHDYYLFHKGVFTVLLRTQLWEEEHRKQKCVGYLHS